MIILPVSKFIMQKYLIILTLFFAINSNAATLFNLMSGIDSFHADFQQDNQFHKQIKTLNGQIDFIAPYQLKIHQKKPFEQVILVNASHTLIYDVDLEQLTKRKTQLQYSPLNWLFNLEKLKSAKAIKQFDRLTWYQIKSNNNIIQIGFKNKTLTQVRFKSQGYQSKIIFSNQQPIQQKQLNLNTPNTVSVIDFTK